MSTLESNLGTVQLLSQGFSVMGIKPLIKVHVAGNGDVTLKATQAIVTLTNSTEIYAYLVDIENGSAMLLAYHVVLEMPSCRCSCT
ncbi:MAG: hypothetical protein QXP03_03955 [Desulfurococcaceae archaeon]